MGLLCQLPHLQRRLRKKKKESLGLKRETCYPRHDADADEKTKKTRRLATRLDDCGDNPAEEVGEEREWKKKKRRKRRREACLGAAVSCGFHARGEEDFDWIQPRVH